MNTTISHHLCSEHMLGEGAECGIFNPQLLNERCSATYSVTSKGVEGVVSWFQSATSPLDVCKSYTLHL